MKRNTDRILVSHAGNLPRPEYLDKLIDGGFDTSGAHKDEFNAKLPEAVKWIVDEQIKCGVDIVNDGEYVKAGSFGGYIHDRIEGYEPDPDPNRPAKHAGVGARDAKDFPGTFASGLWLSGSGGPQRPGFIQPGRVPGGGGPMRRVCTGPVKYIAQAEIKKDAENLNAAIKGKDVQGFIAALGPMGVAGTVTNLYYKTEEEFQTAVADAIREEYKAITDAGLILQIDEPQFLTTWSFYPDWDLAQLRKFLEGAAELINYALKGIPEEQVRFHSCWGSGHRPHVHDIELKHVADLFLKINAVQYSIEAANVRHEHEYHVWEEVKLPPGKMLMPGIVGHATDLVEHPENIAERICNYAKIVGRENVQTGTDCGIGSRVGHEEIVWAKLKAMAEGAAIATKRLWP